MRYTARNDPAVRQSLVPCWPGSTTGMIRRMSVCPGSIEVTDDDAGRTDVDTCPSYYFSHLRR